VRGFGLTPVRVVGEVACGIHRGCQSLASWDCWLPGNRLRLSDVRECSTATKGPPWSNQIFDDLPLIIRPL
jgi:hypothetical protein